MGNPYQTCSVCKAPPDVLAVVNQAIHKKEKFRDLAARTSFSRAALWRHSKKCIPRDAIAEFKARTVNPRNGRMIVEWAHGTYTWYGKPMAASDLRFEDNLLCVAYVTTPLSSVKNPRACVLTEDNFGEFLALARAEDLERAAAIPAGPSPERQSE